MRRKLYINKYIYTCMYTCEQNSPWRQNERKNMDYVKIYAALAIADTSWFYDKYHLIDPIIHCISMSNKLLLSQIVNKCYVLLFVSYHQYKKIIWNNHHEFIDY